MIMSNISIFFKEINCYKTTNLPTISPSFHCIVLNYFHVWAFILMKDKRQYATFLGLKPEENSHIFGCWSIDKMPSGQVFLKSNSSLKP